MAHEAVMFARLHPSWIAFGGSLVLLAGLLALLRWDPFALQEPAGGEPLVIYCAEALRMPVQATARDYEQQVGQKVYLHFGPSQTILTNLLITKHGDLFLPADDSFIELARNKDAIADVLPLARLTAVAITGPGYQGKIGSWADFVDTGHTLGLANPDSTAIGKLLRQRLAELSLWESVTHREPKFMVSVNDVANSVQLGSVDVGVVWDAVAQQHAKLRERVVHLPQLDSVTAKVQIALTKFSSQPEAARRFVRFLRSADGGARYFKEQGYTDFVTEGSAQRPELVVYAGAMLRPAIEPTIIEFEKREGVKVTRVYNGCGILVSQMRAGQQPDLYFACDARFMEQVQDRFGPADEVSSNQLVIAVRKGNPLGIESLRDLGKPGLRVGVGHEQQCALGAITKETFLRAGVHAAIKKNVVVVSPTGDFLINQLRSGNRSSSPSLDAVVAYKSNVTPFADELDGIPVTGIPCAAPHQPLAVSRTTASPELCEKLKAALRSPESKERFEKLGFGWQGDN
jgi:molybdenum ABC transporter molybdate-binding protein